MSLALIGLFVVSLVAGYYAGERFFKPQPVPTPGLVARPEPPPPTAPPTPSATRPRAVRATPQAPEPPAMRQTPAAPEPPSPAVSPPATPAGAGRTPAARATERETPRAEGPLYRVQVGAFASRENADAKLQQLR
ncbi:MAG: SPOR domain-containing protein, partial [Armatimonadetes bacterium]|nr:SPOR domain-containing protein [Armatimonadota bacterium]